MTKRPLTDVTDPTTRRVLVLFASSLIVIGLGGLVAVRSAQGGGDRSVPAQGGAARSAAATGVGPRPGRDLASYAEDRARALAEAKGTRVAVVSFSSYLPETQARAALGRTPPTAVLVAAPGEGPTVVRGPVAEWLNGRLADQRSEREEIRRLLPTVDDPSFKDFYTQEIDRLTAVIDGVKPDSPLVFGAVVRGPAADLRALAGAPGVRLVDVAPTAEVAPTTPARGVRPEETVTAGDPPTRPA